MSARLVPALLLLGLVIAPGVASARSTEHRYDLDGRTAALHRLDVHDAGGRDRPVLVWVHGGGWAIGDKANAIEDKARAFREAGFLFTSVNYRLSPNPAQLSNPERVRFPDHPRDVAEAVAWLHRRAARFGGDPRRIVVAGHSAGAHLAALVATDRSYLARWRMPSSALRGAVVMDTEALDIPARLADGRPRANEILFNAFASPAEEARQPTWRRASPMTHADRSDPEALFVTQAKAPGRVSLGERFARRLGQRPADTVVAVDKSHAEINRHLGRPEGAAMTRRVIAFARSAVRR